MELLNYSMWLSYQTWISLLTLTALEIVLGIDNLVFITLMSNQLPSSKQRLARRWGLGMAVITRLMLLACMKELVGLTTPLLSLVDLNFSVRDLVLLLGGLYLLVEAVREIHRKVEMVMGNTPRSSRKTYPHLVKVVLQIMVLDIIFSLDSVITAVGMAREFTVMALAIIIAVTMMLFATEKLNRFIQTHPTIEILALCFLLLVGVVLIADGFHFHINRNYIYFAIGFSVFVEWINISASRKRTVD
ncbi:MAG: integral membrane protein TerC [uncultured bacterium]|nr:MAG: integral membrane protein TerC [uncultured bacterium]